MIEKIFISIIVVVILLAGITCFFKKKVKRGALNYIIRLFRMGRFQECKEEIEKYLRAFPKSKNGWLMLGNVGLELNEIKLAEKGYGKALEFDMNCDKSLTGMGVVMRNYQRFEEAEDYYYKALKINPDAYLAKSSLMLLEIYKGNNDMAIALGEDSVKDGLDKVEVGVVSNLCIAYHFNNDFEKRDELFNYLKMNEYKDLFYTMMIIEGKVGIEEIMEIKNE